MEEQKWENIEKIIPKITNEDDTFIAVETLMQMTGFVPFSEMKNFLKNPKIPHQSKEYPDWKRENNLQKTEIIPFIEKF